MATLLEFREQYPQYNNTPDLALADSLHQKFYSKIPKDEFFKALDISPALLIPGSENTITLPQPKVSLQDKIMGAVETPAIIAGDLGRAITTPLARMYGEATGGQGTPQGKAAGEEAAQAVSRQFYQPRTQTGPEIVGGIGKVLAALPPTLGATGSTLTALTGPALQQTNALIRPAIAPAKNALVSAVTKKPATVMQGGGAASTAEDLMRNERLNRFGIRATQGERTGSLAQQQFESDVQRGVISNVSEDTKTALTEEMKRFRAGQKKDILSNFDNMTAQTGAEIADPSMTRQIGKIVDKALNDEYTKKFNNYKDLYAKADNAGETLQQVPYQNLLDYINTKTPTARKTLDPILDSVAESLAMNDPNKTGTITVRALEDIYQQIGKVKNSASAGEMKQIVTQLGEGAGGEMYQAARSARKQLAKEFEDVSRVDKLLGTKAGYQDRRVALDDVFKHTILDGSLEEMRTVTSLLKKAGPEGRQAYAELQGQTLQHMKDMLTKGDDLSFKNLNTLIKQLDSEDKLAYMFGKTGRDQILELRDAIKDVVVKQPGAVNYPNTASAVLRGLESLQSLRIPGVKSVAEMARTSQLKGKVKQALEQPNKLIPEVSNTNALIKD
jgi:hypothetical protein